MHYTVCRQRLIWFFLTGCLCVAVQKQQETERAREAAWDLEQMSLARKGEELERKEREMQRERKIQLNQYNMRLAREQQAQ